MLRFKQLARTLHRWLSYVVFLQLTLWIVGGLTFAVIPFDSIIKGGAVLRKPQAASFDATALDAVAPALAELGSIAALNVHQSSEGPLLEVATEQGRQWFSLIKGEPLSTPTEASVARYANSLYAGEGALSDLRYIDAPESRYGGLVDELGGRVDVWQANFDDTYGTRLYFDAATGRYLTVRNDFWVLYDAMWRLHIMDYSDGSDFNNSFLRILTPLALLFALSGLVLTWTAARRAYLRATYTAKTAQ